MQIMRLIRGVLRPYAVWCSYPDDPVHVIWHHYEFVRVNMTATRQVPPDLVDYRLEALIIQDAEPCERTDCYEVCAVFSVVPGLEAEGSSLAVNHSIYGNHLGGYHKGATSTPLSLHSAQPHPLLVYAGVCAVAKR